MKSLILFFVLFFLFSCTDTDKNSPFIFDDTDFQIIKMNYTKSIPLSMIVNKVKYIPLTSSDSALIGTITKLLVYDSTIYVYDRNNQGIYGFGFNGENRFVINDRGGGKGRFQSTIDFEVSDSGIELIDQSDFSLLKYTLNGKFVDETNIGFYIEQFIRTENKGIVLLSYTPDSKGQPYNGQYNNNTLYYMSSDFNKIYSSYFPFAYYEDVLEPGRLCKYGPVITYVRSTLGRFYYFNSEINIKPRFKIDFGKYKIPENLLVSGNKHMLEEKFMKGDFASLIGQLLETKNYFFFQFYIGGTDDYENLYFAILEKSSGKCTATKNIINDVDGGSYHFPVASFHETLISSLDPDILKEVYLDNKNIYNNSKLDSITTSLNYLSNPVLMIQELKNRIEL